MHDIMKAVTVHVLLGAVTLLSLTSVLAQNNCNLRARLVTYRYWINYPYTYGTYQVTEYYCDFSEHPSSLPEGLLRLADQDTQANHVEGRPEVYHSGEWGTICDEGWDSNDAHSVCQQLGFSGPDQTCCSSQGSGTGTVWIENLQCEITDDWISQDCGITTWGSTCDHSQDAGVRCERAPRVRLVNGNDINILRGRVEYRHGNAWGKVCDDYWDDQDSQVVCHQLGFGTHTSFTTHTTTPRTIDAFGNDIGAYFLMDNLFCFGSEIALHHCAHNGWENHNCYYYEAVGLYCSMPVPRISAGGSSSSSLHVSLEMLEGLQYSVNIIGYHVEYRESGDSSWLERTVDATSYRHSFNLTRLNAYTTYQLRAAVLVQEFMGRENITYSDVLQATTFEGAPGPVSSLNVVAASATSITVSWGEPAQTNGRISDYVITYTSITPGIPHSGKIIASSTATSYTLMGLQEFTTYAVTVSARTLAAEGVQTNGSTTTFEAVPSASPNEVGATPLSANLLSLSWVPPDLIGQNGPITSYDVMYSGGDTSAVTHDVGSSTTYVLAGLQPYTTYSIRVAAKNSQGRGPFSPAIEQATLEAAPSGPPLNVTLTALSAESLQVMWQHPSIENGQISAYTVHWGRDLNNPISVAVQGDALSYRITGTLPYTIYHARVAASTSGGQGPFSSWRTDTTLSAAPTAAPLNVVVRDIGSTSVRVTWMPPPEDARNGPITAYLVVFGLASSSTPLSSAEVSNTMEYTVSSLQPYTQFYVQVAAKTSAGIGPYSQSMTFDTLSDAPGAAPGDVILQSDPNQAAITVSWSPLPSQFYNSEELTGYTIHYEANDVRIQSSGDVATGPSTTSRILTGLHARVAYTISVAAVNAQGTGPYSSEQTAITSGQAPDSAPVGVSATATSPTSIQVRWSSPPAPDHQLPILTYTVSYQLVGNSASSFNKTVTGEQGDTHSTDITGLRAYKQYLVTVYSNNELGQSPPSDQVTVRTLSDIPLFAPNFTSSLVLATEITLMWQPLTEEQARGNVVQYLINWSGGATLMLGPDTTSHMFSVDPATAYTFTIAASTAGGIGPYSDSLSVTSLDGIPSAPREFRATVVSPTTIRLTWQAPSSPNGAYVYLITIFILGATSNESLSEIQVESSVTQYTVDGLEENTQYEFFLQAVTSAGKGERVITTAQTSEAAPSSPPLNVTALAVSATAISVSWESPPIIHHNSPLTGYMIQYRTATVGSVSMEMEVSSPQQLQAAVVGLTPYTVYYVKVAAVNTIDTGPYSREVSVETMKSEPSQPQGLSITAESSTQLRMMWTLPDNPNGILLGYTLRYEASYPPGIDSSGEELPGPDATSLLIVDLQPGTSYNIYLLARNDFGMSGPVQGTGYTMPEDPTAAPSVSVSALSSMTLRVVWYPPATTSWKGTIQELHLLYGLVVYNETEDAMEQRLTIPVSPLAQPNDVAGSMNITGLMAFTEYYVRMSLVNDAGEGPFSDPTSAMTLHDLPSAVRDLSVHVNHTSVTATWSTPKYPNGELLHYKVYLDGVFLKTVPSSSYKVTIDNLKPRSQHIASVSAVTGAGEGEASKYAFQTADAPAVTGVVSGQTAAAGSSPLLFSLIGAGVVMVLIVVAVVILLGVLAWRRVKAAKLRKSPGYAIDSLTLYDDNPFADTEGYQVQENPGASGLNPVFMGAGDIKGQLASLEKALEDYQSGDYYESGENSDKKPLV